MKKNVFISCSFFIGILLFTPRLHAEIADATMLFAHFGEPPEIFVLMCNGVEVHSFHYNSNVESFILDVTEKYLTFVLIAVFSDREYASPPHVHEVIDITPEISPVQEFQMSKEKVTIKMIYSG